MNLNEVTIAGHLGKDPLVVTSENGKATFVKCTVATNEKWKSEGETLTHTEWHIVELNGNAANFAASHCSTGDSVFIRGALRTRSWTDKDGGKRTEHVVAAYRFEILQKKEDKTESHTAETEAQ